MELGLWKRLAASDKTVVLYGMGNGADKVLAACAERGIAVADVFASDGFVRGQLFHGKAVLSWSAVKEKYGADHVIVLLSFGSSRPDVLENILRIASEAELYAPDVPAFGDGLFDMDFARAHRAELEEVYALLADDLSRSIFEEVVRYKLDGDIRRLMRAASDPDADLIDLVQPTRLRAVADLGAYTGDTVRQILDASSGSIQTVYAMEPDARSFRRLSAYAESETRARVIPIEAGAWSEHATLVFDAAGNRNSSAGINRSATLCDRPVKLREVRAEALDDLLDGKPVDYIKYDVEGSEREAILGSRKTIAAHSPTLLVSLYHRNEDIFSLPLLIHSIHPSYSLYLRRPLGIPAWDLNLFCR